LSSSTFALDGRAFLTALLGLLHLILPALLVNSFPRSNIFPPIDQ
jgi:hypothetical protein